MSATIPKENAKIPGDKVPDFLKPNAQTIRSHFKEFLQDANLTYTSPIKYINSMKKVSSQLNFLLNLATAQAKMARRFDGRRGGFHGLGQNDFRILYYLSQAEGEKMRRIDLAEKVGLTASGITRLLMPMEKIGLIKREATKHDARVSFVLLAPGGKRLLSESMERAELLAEEIIPTAKSKRIEEMTGILSGLN